MRIQRNSKSIVCCFMAFLAGSLFFSMANQAEAQLIYTISGFAGDTFPLGPPPVVGSGESFTATFEIDASAVDAEPDNADRGVFTGAIISSSIEFSGGFSSTVDFSGGNIAVLNFPDSPNGGFILQTPDEDSSIVLFTLDGVLPSDALPTEGEIPGAPQSLFHLADPAMTISNLTNAEFVTDMFLSITAAPSVNLGDVDRSGTIDFSDIPPFISALLDQVYQAEADCDQNGVLSFEDIPPFTELLLGE